MKLLWVVLIIVRPFSTSGSAWAADFEPLFGAEKACVISRLFRGKWSERADPAPKFSRKEWSNPYPRNTEGRVLEPRLYTAEQSRAVFENFTLALESARENKGPQGVAPIVLRDLLDRASALLESRGIAHQVVPDEVGVIEILGDPEARGTLNGVAERMGEKYRVRVMVDLEQMIDSEGVRGSYNRFKKQILINRPEVLWPKNRVEQTVLHEIRHAFHSRALAEGRPSIYSAWFRGDLAGYTSESLYGNYMSLEEVDTWGYDTRAAVHRVRQAARGGSKTDKKIAATLAQAEKKASRTKRIMSSGFSLLAKAEETIRDEPTQVRFFRDEWDGLTHARLQVAFQGGRSYTFEMPLPDVSPGDSRGGTEALLKRIQELKLEIAKRNHQSTFDTHWIQAMQKIAKAGRSVPEAMGWVDQAGRSGRALEQLKLARERLPVFEKTSVDRESAMQAMLEILSAADVETRRPQGPNGESVLEFWNPRTGKGLWLDSASGELMKFIQR